MTSDLFIILLGVASSATLVFSALSTHKPRLLIFSLITTVLVSVQYGFSGAMVGLGACIVGFLRTSTVLASQKWEWLNHWIMIPVFILMHAGMFALVNDWAHIEFYNFIPLVGSVLGVTAIYFKNLILTKSLLIGAGALWLVYEFFTGAYGHMIGETLTIAANIVAISALARAAKAGVEVEEPVEELIRTITTSIPIITEKVKEAVTGTIPIVVIEPTTDTRPLSI